MPQGLERMHAGSSPYSTAPFRLWKLGAEDLSFYAPIHHPTTVGNDSAALRHLVFLLHLYQSHPVRSGGSCAPRKTDARHYARSHRAGPCGIGPGPAVFRALCRLGLELPSGRFRRELHQSVPHSAGRTRPLSAGHPVTCGPFLGLCDRAEPPHRLSFCRL